MKNIIITGSRTGDLMLAGLFALAIGVGILTTSFLWKYEGGGSSLVSTPVPVSASKPVGLVVLGDSLAQGVGASASDKTLAARIYAAREDKDQVIWNLGLAGSKAENVRLEQLPRLSATTPSTVFVLVGANDVTGKTDPVQFEASYRQLLDGLADYRVPVVILTIPKLSLTPAIPEALKAESEARTLQLNTIIRRLAGEGKSHTVVDLYVFSSQYLLPDAGLLSEDNFHPNDEGYAKMAETVLENL